MRGGVTTPMFILSYILIDRFMCFFSPVSCISLMSPRQRGAPEKPFSLLNCELCWSSVRKLF